MLSQIYAAELEAEQKPASPASPSRKEVNKPNSALPTMNEDQVSHADRVFGTPQITWPLPVAHVLSFNPTNTHTDTEAFPDYPNPANNLVLARTALLGQLDAVQNKKAYLKLRPGRSLDAIHSRVVSYTGHIKENENLNRSRAKIAATWALNDKIRKDRARGNKGKLVSQRHLYASTVAKGRSERPLYELQKKSKVQFEREIREAFALEREHGWAVVTEEPLNGESRDFHDPYWQLRMISPLQPGTEVTKKVITSLLKLKQTFPFEYLAVKINPAAVALGLNGRPPSASETATGKSQTTKAFKPSRLLGWTCNSSRASRRSSSSSSGSDASMASTTPINNSTGKTLKAKTAMLMRRVATKMTLGRRSKKSKSESESESEYEDSDDEYADAVEFLKQEEQSRKKVSRWLTLSFDGKPFDGPLSTDGPSAIEPSDTPFPSPTASTPTPSIKGVVASASALGPTSTDVSQGHGLAASSSPISNLLPSETSIGDQSHWSDDDIDNDSDHDHNEDSSSITAIETITLQKPKSPIRLISIRRKKKTDNLNLRGSLGLTDDAGANSSRSVDASPRRPHGFHGALVATSGQTTTGTTAHSHVSIVRSACADAGAKDSRPGAVAIAPPSTTTTNTTLSFSQRQREFLHRKYHQVQGQVHGQGHKVEGEGESDKTRRKSNSKSKSKTRTTGCGLFKGMALHTCLTLPILTT